VRSENLHHSAKRGGQYNFEAAVVFDVYDSGSWLCVHFLFWFFVFVVAVAASIYGQNTPSCFFVNNFFSRK
jgi:hypothetical protein